MNRLALGRGLDALIPTQPGSSPTEGKQVLDLAIEKITPNPNQPRQQFNEERLEELTASVREKGVLQPILVKPTGDTYQIIAGERRFRAAKAAGLTSIPAIVADRATKSDELEWALIENLQRDDLNILEEAAGYKRLADMFQYTQQDIATKVGKDRSSVANTLRLLALPETVQDKVRDGRLSAGHARALLALELPHEQVRIAKRIVSENLSVRKTEELIYGRRKRPLSKAKPRSAELEAVEQQLRQKFGTTVHVTESRKRGRIVIDYFGHDDLNRILDVMNAG
ncbi:MAG: ParB/RepB/Spo0J family partition protein [Candidatus Zixiibacteriota bacterium]